jgi:hypothetical protein
VPDQVTPWRQLQQRSDSVTLLTTIRHSQAQLDVRASGEHDSALQGTTTERDLVGKIHRWGALGRAADPLAAELPGVNYVGGRLPNCRRAAEQPTTAPQTQATVRHTHPARTIRTGYGADQAMAAGRSPVQRKKITKTAVRAEPTALRRATHAHPAETPTQLTAAEERAGDGRCDSNPKPRDSREEKQGEARRTRRQ